MLVVLGGLPGVGKTTIAARVAGELRAAHLRVDAIEAGIVTAGLAADQRGVGAAGYLVARNVADSCLRAGTPVVADAVHPVEESREPWRELAARRGVPLLCVEVVCRSADVHRARVRARTTDLPGLVVPSWERVTRMDYQPWRGPRLVVDSTDGPDGPVARIVAAVT